MHNSALHTGGKMRNKNQTTMNRKKEKKELNIRHYNLLLVSRMLQAVLEQLNLGTYIQYFRNNYYAINTMKTFSLSQTSKQVR